ncbi:glycosyltransferase family 4 protein [Acidisphaera sp. L21]|uniref:glycosyltransferase family 4 protein n=1 Tax=Acidisphaera sp. L21 TaxID=1641851 RepID=UPI00131BC32A|nr:glycosyltransferase family 4 protein [Acidisphaera sp. L21]
MQKRNGISHGAALQVAALRRAGLQAELLDATAALRNPRFRIPHQAASAYVFHSGGPQLAAMVSSVLPQARHAWRIAYWAWELAAPPKDWPQPGSLVQEIWTPSRFARDSLARRFTQPMHVVPHAIPVAPQPRFRPDQPFTVLTMADSRSSYVRKNPAGAVRAFCQAFGPDSPARLLVKLNGKGVDRAELLGDAQAWPNIQVIDGFLDDDALRSLYLSADVLLSLHRAEGFGLPMLEAMALGVPVIATAYSGNLDFMTEVTGMLVPARTVPVHDTAVYMRYADAVWADPDEAAAAAALRRLAGDPGFYAVMAQAAYRAAEALATGWQLPPG